MKTMKRDPDLIRHILLKIEENDNLDGYMGAGVFVNDRWLDKDEINFHLKLLLEAGYIKGVQQSADNKTSVMISRLTWEGYEFLDAARDDGRWKAAKEAVGQAGGFTFDLMKPVLVELAAQTI